MAKFKFSVIQKILIKSIKTSHRLGDKNLLKNSYAEYIKNCYKSKGKRQITRKENEYKP